MTKSFYKIICGFTFALLLNASWLQTTSAQTTYDETSDENLDNTSSDENVSNEQEPVEEDVPTTAKTVDTINAIKNQITDGVIGKKIVSLMYNNEETNNIERAVESFKTNQIYVPDQKPEDKNQKDEKAAEEDVANAKSYVYLASIIYFNSRDWAVWIGDQKIIPETNKNTEELYVKSISRDQVNLVWTLSLSKWKILSHHTSDADIPPINANNKVEISFSLKPNQTFILGSSSVAEGNMLFNTIVNKQTKDKNVSKKDMSTSIIKSSDQRKRR